MIPRRDCLGLIEAGRTASADLSDKQIPRRDCLGLIEAIPLILLYLQPLRFRGVIASASLKPYFFFVFCRILT